MAAPADLVAIVPAAGRSRRMGRDKLLLPWGETVVVGSVVAALAEGGAARIVVVAPPGNAALRRWARRSGVEVAINARPERGMLSTIVEGLEHLGGAAALAAGRGLLVCPGDHAGLTGATVRRLVAVLEAGAPLAVPVHDGRRGHPLAISGALIERVPDLDPAVGLRALLDAVPGGPTEVAVDDPAVTRDVDTPSAYAAARRREPPPG